MADGRLVVVTEVPGLRVVRDAAGAFHDFAAEYATYLDEVRGLTASTVAGHCATVAALLTDIDYELTPERLRALTPQDIEAFVRRSGARLKRSSLQGVVA